MMKKRFAWALVALFGLTANPVLAACTAGDLAGTYQLYATWMEPGGGAGWITCRLRVRTSGSVDAASCVEREIGEGRFGSRLNGGNLDVTTACKVTGRLRFTEGGENFTIVVENAWLSRNDQVLAGVGRESVAIVQFTAIRK